MFPSIQFQSLEKGTHNRARLLGPLLWSHFQYCAVGESWISEFSWHMSI